MGGGGKRNIIVTLAIFSPDRKKKRVSVSHMLYIFKWLISLHLCEGHLCRLGHSCFQVSASGQACQSLTAFKPLSACQIRSATCPWGLGTQIHTSFFPFKSYFLSTKKWRRNRHKHLSCSWVRPSVDITPQHRTQCQEPLTFQTHRSFPWDNAQRQGGTILDAEKRREWVS